MNGKITAKKLVSKGGVVIAVIIAFIIFAIGAPSVQPLDLQLACLI